MIRYHDFEQGSEDWIECRRGLMTASEMKLLVSPSLKYLESDKERAHVLELAAQRISKFVELHYITDDMLRGNDDEIRAKAKYEEVYKRKLHKVGFITNDKFGFTLGYSPDGMIEGENAAVECKSRRQKWQLDTINRYQVPVEHIIQVQTGMMVAELDRIDFVSYSGGWPMATMHVYPDRKLQEGIFAAAYKFEERIKKCIEEYNHRIELMPHAFIPTERVIEPQEMLNE